MASIEKKVSKSVIFQFLNFSLTGIIGLVFIPILISSLGSQKYGVFEMVFSLNIINVILDIGIGSTIVNFTLKYFDQGRQKYSEFLWNFLWLKFLLGLIGCCIALFIGFNVSSVFSQVGTNQVPIIQKGIIYFSLGVIIQNINSFITAIQNGHVRFDQAATASIVSKIGHLLIFFTWHFYFEQMTIPSFCFLTFIFTPLIKLFVQMFQFYNHFKHFEQPLFLNKTILIEVWDYLRGISLITLIAQILVNGSQFLLSIFATPNVVGLYGIVSKIVQLVNNISSMVLRPVLPAIKHLTQKYEIKALILRFTKLHTTVIISLIAVLLSNSRIIDTYYLQNEYSNFLITFFVLLLPIAFPTFGVMLMIYYSQNKTYISLTGNILNTILSLSGALVGFKLLGFSGFIGALAVGACVTNVVQTYRFTSFFELSLFEFYRIYIKRYIIIIPMVITCFILSEAYSGNIKVLILMNIVLGISLLFVNYMFLDKIEHEWIKARIKLKNKDE